MADSFKNRLKFAWAQYYNVLNERLHDDRNHYAIINRSSADVSVPQHIKDELIAMATELKKKWECPVCFDMIEDGNLEITNCGHFYCKECLENWKKAQKEQGKDKWKCCMCNRQHKH